MPNYDVSDIANYFLLISEREGQELLSNMKLQKLLYYAQGLHIALGKGPLFSSSIEAWTYGPVVPFIYHKYKKSGSSGISPDPEFNPAIIDEETKDFLDEINKVFGQFSAIRLMELSHTDECWQKAATGSVIPQEFMASDLKKYLVNGQE